MRSLVSITVISSYLHVFLSGVFLIDRYGFVFWYESRFNFSLVGMGTLVERCFVLIRMSLGCFGVTLDSRFVLTSTAMETCSSVLE